MAAEYGVGVHSKARILWVLQGMVYAKLFACSKIRKTCCNFLQQHAFQHITDFHGKIRFNAREAAPNYLSVNTWKAIANDDNTLQLTICCSACQRTHVIACGHNTMSLCCCLVSRAQYLKRSASQHHVLMHVFQCDTHNANQQLVQRSMAV